MVLKVGKGEGEPTVFLRCNAASNIRDKGKGDGGRGEGDKGQGAKG